MPHYKWRDLMGERTAAEIINWPCQPTPEPGCDDLLEWILSRPAFNWTTDFGSALIIFGGPLGYTVILEDRDGDSDSWSGMTLLLTLERAVRGIAVDVEQDSPSA